MLSIMGQALINSDPKNPEGYKLLTAFQRAHFQWSNLLTTITQAQNNGVYDSFLCYQAAIAFLELRDFEGNAYALIMSETLARDNDK